VADKEHGSAFRGHTAHPADAFSLKLGISYGEHFVDEQDLGFQVRRDGKTQA